MEVSDRTGRRRRVGTTLAWVVGLPTVATAVAILAFAAASYRAKALHAAALQWSDHLAALHELAIAAHDYADDVESRLGLATAAPLAPAATPGDAAARVRDAARRSRALADRFGEREREEEEALWREVERLLGLGQAALRDETSEAVAALGACYRGEIAPRIAARIAEEQAGAFAAFDSARSGSAGLLGAATSLAALLVAVATWRSLRLARRLGRSLGLLGEGARSLAGGDLSHRMGIAPEDELGDVAGAFDHMAEALREQQERLVASERMAAVGLLAAGVAHDVNSPLAFILSNVAYAIDVLGDPGRTPADEDDALAALREARGGAERVRDIVRALGGTVLTDAPCGAATAARTGS